MRNLLLLLLFPLSLMAQDAETYVQHSSGLFLGRDASSSRGVIFEGTSANVKPLQFLSNDDGTFCIAIPNGEGWLYLTLDGSWNTTFLSDAETDNAHFTMETDGAMVKFRCKANGKYLGTDGTSSGSYVYADKDGTKNLHQWRLASSPDEEIPVDTISYIVNPGRPLQRNEGWGVSLCWWANMCGKWTDAKINQIVDWLVSPTGLNYNIFRYNIGGGDDPLNRNCTPHHMGNGKGLRAEMEGFKDSTEDVYHWDRDAAQRKIMLKIRERRPDAIFEAFSNSAPYYMTYSGCVGGAAKASDDNLRPEYYEEFAHYLVDVCKHYYDEYGIVFKTLEPFNEPNTSYWGQNGSQEGCHFGYASQVAFLRVLAPILDASGLPTIISASDETNVGTSVGGFKAYQDAGVLDLVGQWNTHTYSASTRDRAQVGLLARSEGKLLWQSETGSGGSGLAGNLALMQRAIDDIRLIMPDAWVDWQYMEENNDQWCMIRGSFANQTYERVKSYYCHQQMTRFIPVGYRFVSSLQGNTLAALNPQADTLVMVFLNTESIPVVHRPQILFAQPDASRIKAWRTSQNENLQRVNPQVSVPNAPLSSLTILLPAQSITTLQIPLTDADMPEEELECDVPYLIQPQYNTQTALTASSDGQLTIENVKMDSAQVWFFRQQGTGLVLQNASGQYINDGGSSYAMQALTDASQASLLNVIDLDPYFCRIMTDATKAFDLNQESYSAGTRVGHYNYGSSVSAGHRNWQLMRLPLTNDDDGIDDMAEWGSEETENLHHSSDSSLRNTIYDLSGRRISPSTSLPFSPSTSLPFSPSTLRKGIYLRNGRKFVVR